MNRPISVILSVSEGSYPRAEILRFTQDDNGEPMCLFLSDELVGANGHLASPYVERIK